MKNKNFTIVPNELINNDQLTLEEKALLIIIMSNSSNFKVFEKELIKRSLNGRDAHRKIIKGLIKKGFIIKHGGGKKSNGDKQIINESVYYSVNYDNLVLLNLSKPSLSKPSLSKPSLSKDNNTNTNNIKSASADNNTKVNNNTSSNEKNFEYTKEAEADFKSDKLNGIQQDLNKCSINDFSNEMDQVSIQAEKVSEIATEAEKTEEYNNSFNSELNSTKKTNIDMKKTYSFQINEKPDFNKLNEFCSNKGYDSSVAHLIYEKLIDSNYQTADGTPIKFLDSWLNKELKNHKPSIYNNSELRALIDKLADIYTFNVFDDLEAQQQALNNRYAVKNVVEYAVQNIGQEKVIKALKYLVKNERIITHIQLKQIFDEVINKK